MASLQVADRILITVRSTLFNQRIMSTFTYAVSSITGVPSQASAFTALHTKLTDANQLIPLYRACCAEALEVNEVWYQVFYPSRYVKITKTSGLGLGTYGEFNYQSANQAAVILRRGDLGNRHNISTLHMPLPSGSGAQSDGNLGPDIQAPLEDLAAYLPTEITTSGVVMTLTPIINNGPGAGDLSVITTSFLSQTVRTMRRRNVGQGI